MVTEVILLGVNLRWMRRFAQLTWRVSRHDLRVVVVDSLPFWANDVFLTFYTSLDITILGGLAGSEAVGYYRPASQLFAVALFVPSIVGMVMQPTLSRLGVDAKPDFDRVGRRTMALLVACGVPITIALATFAQPLIVTIYGTAYRPTAPVLVVLSLCLLPMYLNMQSVQTLTARDQQWRWTVIMAIGCVLNPALNFVLIPLGAQQWHNAALGAALALLGTEIFMMIYGGVVLHGMLRDRALGRAVLGAAAAGLAQFAMLAVTGALWPPLSEALGLLVYGGVALRLGALPRHDVALLWHTILDRSGGRLLAAK